MQPTADRGQRRSARLRPSSCRGDGPARPTQSGLAAASRRRRTPSSHREPAMVIASFDNLLHAARHQAGRSGCCSCSPQPACLTTRRPRSGRFEAGEGGTLTPLMCVDKTPEELASFAHCWKSRASSARPGISSSSPPCRERGPQGDQRRCRGAAAGHGRIDRVGPHQRLHPFRSPGATGAIRLMPRKAAAHGRYRGRPITLPSRRASAVPDPNRPHVATDSKSCSRRSALELRTPRSEHGPQPGRIRMCGITRRDRA